MLDRLNDAINEVFLGGRFESRPIYLVLDNHGRQQLSSQLGISADEVESYCCDKVSAELERAGDPYSRFEALLWRWSLSGRKTRPPFTALLFALAHAAEQMVTDGEFTAGNYYDRLSALVNISPGRLSQHGRSTEPFWKAFNGWLANNDFAFGRPTARAVNANRYVGIAMSQAIVREADRQRFHLMFDKYGFTNTDEVSESEIEQYISIWIRGSQPTRQLKEAWQKAELRSRICEAAIAELEEWQAETSSAEIGEGIGGCRLSLAVAIRHDLLGRTIALYFGKQQASDPVELVFNDDEQLELSNTTFAGFATLEPRSSIPLARSLLHGIELKGEGATAFKWGGRPAIPLSKSDQGYWTEVSRVSLGVEHLVLVRDDKRVKEAIEAALEEAAAPGYTIASPGNLKGLPPGWVLYEKVFIRRALAELRGFESVLSPVGDTANFSFEAGMKLGRDIWHLWQPPAVHLDGGTPGVSIAAWEGTSADGEPLCSVASEGTTVVLGLADRIPASGNLYFEGVVARSTVASASVLFRSANRPRPRDRQASTVIAYTGILSTTVGKVDVPVVRGLVAPERPPVCFDLDRLSAFGELHTLAVADAHNDETAQPRARSREGVESIKGMTPEEVMALPCAVRGLHRLWYAAIPPGAPRYAPVDVQCLDCGMTYLHRRKPTPTPARPRQQRPVVPESRQSGLDVAKREIDYDLWLDGACFLGTGSASVFETFAASADVDTWRAGPVLRDLAWLGHLDVETGPTHRAKKWSVGRPALSFTAPDRAVFSGFRCRSLTEKVAEAVSARGGRVEEKRRKNHPAVLAIEGLDDRELQEVVSGLRDPHGREIAVVTDAPEALIAYLEDRSCLVPLFRPVSLGADLPIQRFEVGINRWRSMDGVSGVGAYRVSEAGTSYVFVAPSGRAYSAPHELVKLAAARAVGAKVHAYDQSTREFTCRLGCEPVGLLGRALVACAGELPLIEAGIATFKNVSPGVAAGVLHYLYDGELPA